MKRKRWNCHNCNDVCSEKKGYNCELTTPFAAQMIDDRKVKGFVSMMTRLNLRVDDHGKSGFSIVKEVEK